MDSAMEWLATRTPRAPDELTAWMETTPEEGESETPVGSRRQALVRAGLGHLDEAVARPGRDREAARRLLAADALITYACEAASEADHVDEALADILAWVSGGEAPA